VRRRDFIAGLGGAAAWPAIARSQQPGLPVIGLLSGASFEGTYAPLVDEIRQGLKEAGFVEGQNVLIEYRSADGRYERLRDLAADLVRRQVAVIVALGSSRSARAAKATTSTIPIVFAIGVDAVEIGLVKSLNKPEANLTGMSLITTELMPKRLDLLRELVPQARLFGYLDNFGGTTAVEIDLVSAARSMGREVSVFPAGTAEEIERAFASMVQQGIQAVLVSADAYLSTRQDQIVSLARLHALPAMYSSIRAARVGGLIGYHFRLGVMYRQAGIYAGRILKGAKPADLPVQLPTRFHLNINLQTAKALGLTVPPRLLVLADEVIE